MIIRKIARPLLATAFVGQGVETLLNIDSGAEAVQPTLSGLQGMPDPVARNVPSNAVAVAQVTAASQVIGGLLLATGRIPRVASAVLAATVVPANLGKHMFWTEKDPEVKADKRRAFLADVSLVGGLILFGRNVEHPEQVLELAHDAEALGVEVFPGFTAAEVLYDAADPYTRKIIIDKGLATTDLLVQVLVAKYADHLPLYRQESIFARAGLALPRSTLAQWVGQSGVQLQPLVDALRTELLKHSVLHADETPVAMLDPGAGKTHRAYLWSYSIGAHDPMRAVIYDFADSRAGKHAQDFLGDWRGTLVCDDYAGYVAAEVMLCAERRRPPSGRSAQPSRT